MNGKRKFMVREVSMKLLGFIWAGSYMNALDQAQRRWGAAAFDVGPA